LRPKFGKKAKNQQFAGTRSSKKTYSPAANKITAQKNMNKLKTGLP